MLTYFAMIKEETIRQSFHVQAGWCQRLGSPFTARLLRQFEKVLDHTSSTGRKILNWQGIPDATGDALALRVAGALHGLVRGGNLPDLAECYPPDGRMPEDATFRQVLNRSIKSADNEICAWLKHAPQTSEVARSGILYPGMGAIARKTGLPLSLFEVGASGGLNLFPDRFRYQIADQPVGDRDNAPIIAPDWHGPVPELNKVEIRERRGCDLNPLDFRDPEQRKRLLAFVWPDQTDRMKRLEAAIDIALSDPPIVIQSDAADWVEAQFDRKGDPGMVRVLFHSIAYQYFPDEVRKRIRQQIEKAGAQATRSAPVAWLAFEQVEELKGPTLTLRLWRGGKEDGRTQILAVASNAHVHEVTWLNEQS